MKRKVLKLGCLLALTTTCLFGLSSCNKQLVDLTYQFKYAYILNYETKEWDRYEIESWMDFEDGDQIQIKINGKMYLLNSKYCILSNSDELFK